MEKRLKKLKNRMRISDQTAALENMTDEDILLMNEKDPPHRLFGVGGLYQKVKTRQRRSEESLRDSGDYKTILGQTWNDDNKRFAAKSIWLKVPVVA